MHCMRTRFSRREALRLVSLSVLSLPLATAVPGMTSGQETKVSPQIAQYQDSPKGDQRCSGCAHFVAPNSCKIVAGQISAEGWCALFVPKT
jgi:hypothetical protein